MDLDNIDQLLEKYHNAETTIAEEQMLKNYFKKLQTPQHLASTRMVFDYYNAEQQIVLPQKNLILFGKNLRIFLSVAAAVVVFIGVGSLVFKQQNVTSKAEFGTFDDPKIAFIETQKALSLLSTQVNVGIESTKIIDEFTKSRDMIFQDNTPKQNL